MNKKLRQLEEEMTPGECVDEIINALECLYIEQDGIKLPNELSKYAGYISVALRQAKLLKTKL